MTNISLEDYHHLPSGPFLLLSKIIDLACDNPVLSACPNWRSHLPLGLGKSPDGWLSHKVEGIDFLEPLLTYPDYLSQQQQEASPSSLWNYSFKTDSTSLGSLDNPTAFAVMILLTLIIRAIKRVMLPIFSAYGRKVGRATHGPSWEKTNEERIMKFGEYVYRLIFHSLISAYGVWYFWDKPWWDSSKGGTKTLFDGFPHDHPVEPGMAWYYLVQAAYNFDALVTIIELSFVFTWRSPLTTNGKEVEKVSKVSGTMKLQSPLSIQWSPTCRGDFQEMFIHHLVTNALVIGSSYLRLTRIGSMVFLVHDISDVPIDASKLANFVKWKKTTAVCFILLLVAWIGARLGIFPFYIYRAVLFESHLVLNAETAVAGTGPTVLQYYCYKFLFVVLIGMLLLLHVAWFIILMKIFFVLVFKGETQDLSEHKDGEKDHHNGMTSPPTSSSTTSTSNGKKEQ
uniref:TLC domain-containing protein n=1 Tax=Helicotheca tamesis TaxID=374047 RepID=A0A7S2HMM5_9STRA|eukprot:CAMPEP_0185730882 /NCGR_PEP_ID=MMETSP1171-20130828/11276_1 /TAXON_ID=374046 /ORGANISM="Helicotheca tamensis, Strain CCMP826" /LENGTH=453 /DNA_ID=CAMNT_0028400027 /DNA_START=87 /DNA_END=1448 /DNA_ORIENTATION=+